MVGEGVCRCAYWQAQVQCSDARDLSAPLTWQRGDHSATQAQSLDSSPFLYKSRNGRCYTSLDKCSARVVGKPAEKVCCFAERILKPTLDTCDPNNTHSVARIDCPRGKKNSTFFENMGYRGQSCDDWQMLMMSLVDPFFDDLFNEKC